MVDFRRSLAPHRWDLWQDKFDAEQRWVQRRLGRVIVTECTRRRRICSSKIGTRKAISRRTCFTFKTICLKRKTEQTSLRWGRKKERAEIVSRRAGNLIENDFLVASCTDAVIFYGFLLLSIFILLFFCRMSFNSRSRDDYMQSSSQFGKLKSPQMRKHGIDAQRTDIVGSLIKITFLSLLLLEIRAKNPKFQFRLSFKRDEK